MVSRLVKWSAPVISFVLSSYMLLSFVIRYLSNTADMMQGCSHTWHILSAGRTGLSCLFHTQDGIREGFWQVLAVHR